jgi:hypothetical protein
VEQTKYLSSQSGSIDSTTINNWEGIDMKQKWFSLLIIALLVLGVAAFKQSPAQGASVEPVLIPGNPTCESLGYAHGVKVDPPLPGIYTVGNGTVTAEVVAGKYLNWTSTIGIDAVIVKGGPDAHLYIYDPPTESYGDEGLHSPLVSSNKPADISHYDFCFDYELVVTKSADTSMDREWDWEIDKVGDEDHLTLAAGQHYTMTYTLTATTFYTDSNWSVSGQITITNPAPYAATITSVIDELENYTETVDVSCPFSGDYLLAAGETVVCSYGPVVLEDGTERTNTATVTTTGPVGGSSGTANVIFDETACVDVYDDLYGYVGEFCASSDHTQQVFEYEMAIGPYAVCGTYQVTNTASLMDGDMILAEDSHTVDIDVPCEGCTLTQGYWKTHSKYGPAPYDPAWALVLPDGEDTTFYLSGKSYYQVLWTPVAGNAYYILAHQYIATELNILNGASVPPEVAEVMALAQAYFQGNTPTLFLTKSIRNDLTEWAEILDNYNNGAIGPGHCSSSKSDRASLHLFTFPAQPEGYHLFLPVTTVRK